MDRQFSALQHQAQQTAALIQTLADKLSSAASGASAPPYYPPNAQYAQPPQYQTAYQSQYQQPVPGGGLTLQRFLGGRFGQAIVTGAGIGIGDDLVNSIFDRL